MHEDGEPVISTDALLWLGHATVRIEIDGVTILTDPVLRSRIGPARRRAPAPSPSVWAGIDVVLISHLHHDHLDLPSLRLLGPDVPIVVPLGAGSLLERAGFRAVEELIEGRQLSIRGVAVTAMHARHSGFRPPFGPRVSALGYLIEGTRTVYFAGDTGLFPAMAELAPLDVALLPVGGWGPTLRGGHLDPVDAVAALGLMRPRLAVPIHWGTFWPLGLSRVRRSRFAGPGPDFEARARRLAPHTEVAVLAPGGPESRHLPARETAR